MTQVTIKKPDDFHLHFREKNCLPTTVKHCSHLYHYVLAMPNTSPPIFTIADALRYWGEIKSLDPQKSFQPLIALYLNTKTTKKEIKEIPHHDKILGYKLYPLNATTASNWGIKNIQKIYPLLDEMEKYQVPLMIHGEINEPNIDIFDREKFFLEKKLAPIVERFPNLKITLEHITTKEAVDFVLAHNSNLKATITAHHLYINRNDIFHGGIRPHHFCLPIAKREKHRLALVKAATSGNEKFFLGSDSAPHSQNKKENACGCAGIYTAPYAVFLYVEIFYQQNALKNLENFSSVYGKKHYNLSFRSTATITLERRKQAIPHYFCYLNKEKIIPFKNGETINWRLKK